MAKSVIDRLARQTTPDSIEDDLAQLWREAGHDGPVARALMANLVVYSDRPATARVDLNQPIEGVPLDDVAERHPSRLIVLHHCGQHDQRETQQRWHADRHGHRNGYPELCIV